MLKLLRFCLAGLMVLVLFIDVNAQRVGIRRTAPPPPPPPAAVAPDSTELKTFPFPVCGLMLGTLTPKQDHVIRREIRTVPGENFTKEDLVNSQKEIAKLQYFNEATTPPSKLPLTFVEDVVETVEEEELPPPPPCRETNAINMANQAEAYPYLSADGLRLYFTSSREGGHGRFFISTRASVNDPFGKPSVLSRHLTNGYYAGTLTADELTLCMVFSGDMYISIRNSTRDEFPEPVRVQGTSDNYHFGPSISPNGKEIMVMETVNEKDLIRIYKRTGTYSVKENGTLPVPNGEPSPGQYSKNGLAYYFSIEIGEEEHLWRYSRTSLTHSFADLQELPVQMKGLANNLQPTVNGDGSILVFVTSPNSLWQTDDILLVNNVKGMDAPDQFKNVVSNEANTMKVMSKLVTAKLNIYPNPFQANVTIDMSEEPASGTTLTLYDLSGRRLKQEMITNRRTTLSMDKLIAGVYIYHVVDGNGRIISSGKLVKGESSY